MILEPDVHTIGSIKRQYCMYLSPIAGQVTSSSGDGAGRGGVERIQSRAAPRFCLRPSSASGGYAWPEPE